MNKILQKKRYLKKYKHEEEVKRIVKLIIKLYDIYFF